VGEAQVDVKREVKDRPTLTHPIILKLEPEGISGFSVIPNPPPKSAASRSSTGDKVSHRSEVGPDAQTEGKRVSDPRLP
jgi:hypothetical protein